MIYEICLNRLNFHPSKRVIDRIMETSKQLIDILSVALHCLLIALNFALIVINLLLLDLLSKNGK